MSTTEKHMDDIAGEYEPTMDARAVSYRAAASLEEMCAVCTHFSSSGEGGGHCALVAGRIRADYTCDMWAPLESELRSVVEARFRVRKADDAKQMIFGWASVAVGKDGNEVIDSQGDTIEPDVLEAAAYEFVLQFREGDEMHTDEVKAHLVESFVVTEDKLEALAKREGEVDAEVLAVLKASLPIGWWTGFHIPDRATYEKARESYPMFSIGGVAMREEVP